MYQQEGVETLAREEMVGDGRGCSSRRGVVSVSGVVVVHAVALVFAKDAATIELYDRFVSVRECELK